MNAGIEPTEVANGGQRPRWSKSRVRWRGWLLLLVLAGAALWFVLAGRETPKSRTEDEARRILSSVRRNDRTSFNIYAVLDAMRQWPQPFPKLARAVLGPDSVTDDPALRLAAFGRFAVPVLTNALATDRNAAVRAIAAAALGQTHDLRLAPGLLASFSTEHEARVQAPILQALGELGAAQAEPLLIEVLMGTNDSQVRVSAAHALGQLASPTALSALTNALLTAKDSSLRQWIVMISLQSVSDPIVKPALLTVLRSDTNDVLRRSAAQALRAHPGEDTAAALILSLREDADTRSVRPAAIDALREMTNSVIQPALLEAVQQDAPEVRTAAAKALENFPGGGTESALLETLATDSVASVREASAAALGSLASLNTNHASLPRLIESLQRDADPAVRAAAASALNRIGGEEVVNALRAVLETERKGRVQVEAIGGLYRHQNAEAVALLLRLLDNPNLEPDAAAEAVRCLGHARARSATAKLVKFLADSPDEEVRVAAATALGALDNTNAFAALRDALQKDASLQVRSDAATALGGMESARGPATVFVLVTALRNDRENPVRANATAALGALRDPAALPALLAALERDSDREVRANAATALGKLGRPEAAARLEAAFNRDRDHEVRANAVRSLALLTGTTHAQFFLAAFAAEPTIRPELAAILGQIGSPETVAALLKSLQEDGWADRAAVIQALGDAGDTRATATFLEILAKGRDLTSRAAAATALGRLGNAEAVAALETALQDQASTVRQEAAWALGHIGDARAATVLSQALQDRDSQVRFAVAFALAEVGARNAAPGLTTQLQDSDDRARLAAASALAFLDHSEGVRILSDTLHSQEVWKRFTALISLLRLNTAETRRLLTESHDSDATLAAVIEAGLRLGGAGAATNMLCTARDTDSMTEDYRHFGARALVLFNDPATLPALRANANDPRGDVRAAVRVAIRRLQKRTLAETPQPPVR